MTQEGSAHHAVHLNETLYPVLRKQTLDWCITELERQSISFDTIAVSGVSGVGMGMLLAHHYRVSLIVVRKGEQRVSPFEVEYPDPPPQRVLVVDDLSCSGRTVERILAGVREIPTAWVVGILLYVAKRLIKNDII